MPSLRQLRYLVAVGEELHFRRAAERLGIEQPPLSIQIRRLEEEVGFQLFDRSPRHVELTEAGRSLLDSARTLLADVEQAVEEARRIARGEKGPLVLGYAGSIMYTALPRALRAFRERFPEVDLRLVEIPSIQQIEALRAGTIDLALLREPQSHAGIRIEALCSEALCLAVPAGHALARPEPCRLEEAVGEPFIFFPRSAHPALYDRMIRVCVSAGFTPQILQESAEWLTIVALVASGLAISVVPASFERLWPNDVVYRPIDHPEARTPIGVAVRAGRPEPRLEKLIEIAREEME